MWLCVGFATDIVIMMYVRGGIKMDTFEEIMNILSKDQDAQELMARLNDAANSAGFTKAQYQSAKEIVFLIAVKNNPEAFMKLSDAVWNKINERGI